MPAALACGTFERHVELQPRSVPITTQVRAPAGICGCGELGLEPFDLSKQLDFFRHASSTFQDGVGHTQLGGQLEVLLQIDRPVLAQALELAFAYGVAYAGVRNPVERHP